jgi:hypothetical protein
MLTQSGGRWIRLSVKTLRPQVLYPGSAISVNIKTSFRVRKPRSAILATEKNTHPRSPSRAFYTRMHKNGRSLRRRHIMDFALAPMSQMELYCEAHPGSPSALRRPRLFVRGELWIALLGPSVEEGIVGIGGTVTAALRAFDAQYLAGLRPRAESIDHPPHRSAASVAV